MGLRVLGPWGRVFGGRGVGCSGLGDRGVECLGAGGREVVGSGVVSQGGRGSLHRVFWAGDSGAREVDRGVPWEQVAWLF